MKRILLLITLVGLLSTYSGATERKKLNFNAGWRLEVGDFKDASLPDYDDSRWQPVTLPYAFNGHEAFKRDIVDLTDTVCWYRKTFELTEQDVQGKVFIEFEGARQGADVWVNGQKVGFSDNGVMAFGFDLTPYIKKGRNVLAVRCDNSWTYRDRVLNSRYQWNDKNFNANYGGLPKNVWLHVTGKLYQTLPLYSNLGTTGVYVYATNIDVENRRAMINVKSQVINETGRPCTFRLNVVIRDADGKQVAQFQGEPVTLIHRQGGMVEACHRVHNLHFWSWGYGYLYTVETSLVEEGPVASDVVVTRTGFRKTEFKEGKIWLNDRVMMVHGYAQRTSNEWPGVGISVPAWLSDYSNGLMVESGANMVRWMHVTPWKQDIESCDRVGLPQAMPAGDAEKDVEGARWEQRKAVMRDAIIYNRNNPSILFYEGGNESISREHMLELKQIRNQYDPYGGRAIGSREMLDIDEAEYGGEMLYINKSHKHPMWAMEYCRDEGLRKYWDEYSYPFHKEGDGPLYRGKPANDYNHNMDQFAVEMVRRWYDYWRERPGTGTRVSSGGAKIVFSDTNTHHRGESNYRASGVVDAMRLPKDAFYVHQVMWNGWVDDEQAKTYIVGHWNYPANTVKPVYIVSTANEVELFLNGKSLGKGKQSYRYLFTFENITYEPGILEARGSDGSSYKIETAGEPYRLKLTTIENPEGMKADGADMALIQAEVVDKQGRRCPLDNRLINFSLKGEGRWIGGIATGRSDNYVGAMAIPVECGINRVLVRSTVNAGTITVYASADGINGVQQTVIKTKAVDMEKQMPALTLRSNLSRGETPLTPSYTERATGIAIKEAKVGYDSEHALRSFDDNELSEWKNDGRLSTAWITYKLEHKAVVDDICLKLTGWRLRSYPLEIYAGKKLIWCGETERSLGYIHLKPTQRVKTDEITIRLKGAGKDKDAFGGIVEVAQPAAGELDLFKAKNGGDTKNELRIVEVEFLENAAEVVWFDGKSPISYNLPKEVEPVVKIALDMWKDDMRQVTGMTPVASAKPVVNVVQNQALPFDGFHIYTKGGQIIVEGSNGRGMAYGLLELSRLAGVSPWIWWGDVVPERRVHLSLPETFSTTQSPSVAYRGIFINDEDWSLRNWAWKHYEKTEQFGAMGPKTYKAIFQLLLRLRANAIWPAMHTGTPGFFTIPGNKEMADSCGIIIGTSHCEPLLRNNVAEWDHQKRGAYNYMTNREQVRQYWIERLKEVKGSEELFTIGMRGIHDGWMEGVKTKQERREGLQRVIDDQRELIRRYYNREVERVPQVFIPYKEVLEIMESGLRVPDDVTLMWCDDNYGYMTRLSDAEQQKRSGGGGVYYHLSYWGRPHDYLWLTTTQPGLIYSEMRAAYDHNCRRLWIANVHDPKVAAYDLEFFLDMAWDIDAIQPQRVNRHLEHWLCTQFGSEAGKKLAPAVHDFYRLCGMRKPEFMGWTQVELDKRKVPGGKSQVADIGLTRREAAGRLEAFERLKAVVNECRLTVRQELSDAYEAHIVYPIYAAAAMTRKIVSDTLTSHQAYEEIQRLTRQYNSLNHGKWNGLMDAAPRQLPVFENVCGRLADDEPFEGIACNAYDYDAASTGCQGIQMLGHSMNAVSIPKSGELVYHFHAQREGDAVLYTAMIPTQPNDRGDLRYQVTLDDQQPVVISLKEKFRSDFWKLSVLRGQALKQTAVKLTKGDHTLRIKALDDHIIMDQWMIDFKKDRKFYVIPCE